MQGTSRYFQVRDEILIEYIYTDTNNPEVYNTADEIILLMENTSTGKNSLYAQDSSEETFRNVRDLSANEIDPENSRYGYLDIDKPFALNDQLPELTNTPNLPIEFDVDYNLAYDRYKIHFASGYDFEGNDGFIFEAFILDSFGREHNLSSLVYRRSDTYARINPRPFIIGGTEYSTFVEVIIPSTYFLVGERLNDPQDTDKLNFRLTGEAGINTNETLKFRVSTINSTQNQNAQTFFNVLDRIQFSVPIEDEFSGVTANIEEANDGDYFLLSAQYNGGSIQDYIALLNTQPNSNWVILHNLFLLEQIGPNLIETSNESWIQDSNFEEPRFWRPVIRNSVAVSYSIDYNIRLFNRATNEQIIKRVVQNFTDVSQYAKSLKRIDLGTVPVIDEIYNLVQGNSIQMQGFRGSSEGSVQYVPNFFDKANIIVSNVNTFATNNGETQDTVQNDTQRQYKQGELKISISPFDNYLKFVILRNVNNELKFLNITQVGELRIAFTDNNDSEISYSAITTESVNPNAGEVLFYIPSTTAKEIQKFVNREFYITIRTADGRDNLVYSGTFENESERTQTNGLNFIQNLQNGIDSRVAQIDSLNEELGRKNQEIERLTALIATKDEEIQFLKNPNTTIQKTSPAKVNLQNVQNNQSSVKISTSQTQTVQKVESRRKGNLLKQTKVDPNK